MRSAFLLQAPVNDGIQVPIGYWVAFFALISVLLFLDLFLHRKVTRISARKAIAWVAFWVSLAVIFNIWVGVRFGQKTALEFTTGYLIEEALSVDNLFVFIVIFRYFKVKPEYQHRILFWGILGAVVFRLLFVLAGTELIKRFHAVVYFFGLLLIYSGWKLLVQRDVEVDPDRNWAVRLFRRYVPTTAEFEGPRFLVRRDGKLVATPLLLVLLVVETTDVVFAVDSVPAVLAITKDAFIVFTSNVFAILGLRSLYFVLAGMMEAFRYLKAGLSLVLVFVGLKMLLSDAIEIPIYVSLGVVASILATSVVLSLVIPRPLPRPPASPADAPPLPPTSDEG